MENKNKISPEAVVIGAAIVGDVSLAKGVSIWYNAVLRGDRGPIAIGENTNVQDCVVMHETTTVGRGCTIGHGATVHGCTVGDNTLIGMNSVILDGARIGSNCLVGASALVTGGTVIPDGSLVVGCPAKVIRPLTQEEIEGNRKSAAAYLQEGRAYLKKNLSR
ncbi:MAG: gamma carbonic anhydrase family protein [Oscillibacter sp.]|jgi:carbonic anhydrase/acetyltransferase-like protein (isoleucine patch superfamily)|nr:gamma carbonic anhydrase family protein [Oscillibacter sp.]